MKYIRMIQIGQTNNTLICNLISILNSIQSEFSFSFDSDDVLDYPDGLDIGNEIPFPPIEKLIKKHTAIIKQPNEYVIGICDCRFKEGIKTSSDNTQAIITISGWDLKSSEFPLVNQIIFGMIDILLESLNVATPTHYQVNLCPMDYNLSDISILAQQLATSDFCPECRSFIRKAVSRRDITVQQMAAIYKILDFIANRKICFVLMPFNNKFNNVYKKYIQPSFEASNWQKKWICKRADEIHQPSEIIEIIWEQIYRADLIIADLTGRNPNVFYELGFAHALDKNTVLITQSIDDVPFDLRHRQLVEYSPNSSTSMKRLVSAIGNYM